MHVTLFRSNRAAHYSGSPGSSRLENGSLSNSKTARTCKAPTLFVRMNKQNPKKRPDDAFSFHENFFLSLCRGYFLSPGKYTLKINLEITFALISAPSWLACLRFARQNLFYCPGTDRFSRHINYKNF
jgi:hypothetical protein